MARLAIACWLVVLAGCAELPEVEPGVCGNGVFEPAVAEECDSVSGCGGAGEPNACRYVCEATACPAGWACGADQRCRPPTETFMVTGTEAAGSAAASAQDMDGDGAADLTGYDARGLLMRWGDWDGALAGQTRVALPIASAAPAFLDADGDGALDLAVPLDDNGLSLFVSDGARGLIPAAQTTFALPAPADPAECVELVAGGLRSSLAAPKILLAIGGFAVAFIDSPDGCDSSPADCVISVTGGELVDGRLAVAELGYGPANGVVAGEQFAAAVYGSTTVAVWGEASAALRPERIAQWTTSAPIGATGHLWFGRANGGDACPDLIVDTGATIEIAYNVVGPGGACTGLGAALVRYDHPAGDLLAVGDVDGDGRDEILYRETSSETATSDQVLALHPATAPATTSESIGLSVAGVPSRGAVLDYNHDGWRDVVFTIDGSDTLDFYLNYAGAGFNRFAVDVGGAPQIPEVGDYDGDLHDDVAIVVRDTINPDGHDSLLIVYGDPSGQPSAAQFVGQFVRRARPLRFFGGLQAHTDSVLVVSNDRPAEDGEGVCERRMSVLIGDTSRQLVSPFILLYDVPGRGPEPAFPLGLVDVSSGGVPQVLAFGAVFGEGGSTPAGTVISLLGFDGTAFQVDEQFSIPEAQLAPRSLLGAAVRGGDLDGDGVPEVVGVSDDHAAVVSVTGRSAILSELPDDLRRAPWLELVDLDGDLDLDLVGVGGSAVLTDGASSAPASRFWVVWNHAGALDVTSPTVLRMPADLYCFDGDVIGSSPTGLPQLIATCYRSDGATGLADPVLAIATYAPDRSTTEALDTRVLPLDRVPYGLEVADVTGDGLDDVAVLGAATVTLYRQCRRDEAGTAACVAPEALP